MKGKTGRTATTINKAPSKPKKTYTTAAGAQQYVRGNSDKERSANIQKHALSSVSKFDTPLFENLSAASNADASRSIKKTLGPKEAKSNTTVKSFDRHERKWMDRSKALGKK
jgi:hypothetical protein